MICPGIVLWDLFLDLFYVSAYIIHLFLHIVSFFC